MNDEDYNTLTRSAVAEHLAQKSRFIAIATPVSSEDAIKNELAQSREKWPQARHYVYAWRLRAGRAEKSTDDGEPQGTGGYPLLSLLQHEALWNALIVVVRYFGGILLGTGGLTRAYAAAARLAVSAAGVSVIRPMRAYTLSLPYDLYDRLAHFLQKNGNEPIHIGFAESVEMELSWPVAECGVLESWLEHNGSRVVVKTR
jgi:uncharacterized YigZ family protein